MATTDKTATTVPGPKVFDANAFDESIAWIRDFNETLIQAVKESGQHSLDTSEKALHNMLELEEKLVDRSQLHWAAKLADTHLKFVRGMSGAYFTAAREALK
jgi:mannose/cellobiose epimerase-like protein (N-acyl-D-glucosamine 2-epimerase family)